VVAAERRAALRRTPQRLDFSVGMWPIHLLDPILRQRDRSLAQARSVRQDSRRMPSQGFVNDFEKGDVVAFFLEQRPPGDGSI
jgi:hypothetical protein